MRVRFYHASPKRFRVGDHIVPQDRMRQFEHASTAVYLTTSPVPHETVVHAAVEEGWHVYEVEPVGPKIYTCPTNREVQVPAARVLRYVGKARGIVRSAYPNFSDGWEWPEAKLYRGEHGSCVRFPLPRRI